MRGKVLSYIALWIAALVATDPTLSLWSLVWMFPLGLYAFCFPEHRQSAGWTVMIATVILYVVHAVFYFRAKTTRSTLLLGGVLAILLFGNVAGCRAQIHAH